MLGIVRHACRYPVYAAAAEGVAFDAHPLAYAFSWPVWEALDDGRPHRLAVSAGWDGKGHNWYRYPLFGSRLQNQVVYVPPTRDGTPLDYGLEDDPMAGASFAAWIGRLITLQIDTVVTLAPPPPVEVAWVRDHPELFRPLVCSDNGLSCAFSFTPTQPTPAR